MAVIVSYTVPTLSGRGLNRRFYLREEGTPNRREWATRFATREEAEAEADIVAENVKGITGRQARFTFTEVD